MRPATLLFTKQTLTFIYATSHILPDKEPNTAEKFDGWFGLMGEKSFTRWKETH